MRAHGYFQHMPISPVEASSYATEVARIDADSSRPTWLLTLLAPMLLPLGPVRVTRLLHRGHGSARIAAVLIAALVVCGAFYAAVIIHNRSHNTSWSAASLVFDGAMADATSVPPFRLFRWAALGTLGAALAGIIAAWLFLPDIHETGPPTASFLSATTAILSGTGLLAAIVLAAAQAHRAAVPYRDAELIYVYGVLTGLWLLILWMSRAAHALRMPPPADPLPPRCEGCGYDLTHRPEGGVCSECGLSVAESLDATSRRRGWSWEAANSEPVVCWCEAQIMALHAPKRFYQRLRLRSEPAASRGFARIQWPAIGFGAGVGMLVLLLTRLQRVNELYQIPPLAALASSLAGWFTHRFVAAVVMSVWMRQSSLPRMEWGRRVIAYETAFLWAFCAFNGVMISCFFYEPRWFRSAMERLPRLSSYFGLPTELVCLMMGNAILILFWFWRYATATRCVRWSNS